MNQETPKNSEYPSIAAEIIEMAKKDQELRIKEIKSKEAGETVDRSIDDVHTTRMRGIIKEVGWPTISKVGEAVSQMAWLLVQHSPDAEFKKYCLELMKKESESEVDRKNVAYLEDRIRMLEGRPQIYGTQFEKKDNEWVFYPMENPQRVDELRRELGMESLGDYKKTFEEMRKAIESGEK